MIGFNQVHGAHWTDLGCSVFTHRKSHCLLSTRLNSETLGARSEGGLNRAESCGRTGGSAQRPVQPGQPEVADCVRRQGGEGVDRAEDQVHLLFDGAHQLGEMCSVVARRTSDSVVQRRPDCESLGRFFRHMHPHFPGAQRFWQPGE